MYLLNLEQWVSAVFVEALGATFAHSLWQALVALILCHIALSVARKASPGTRYNILIGISVLLALVVAITFTLQLDAAPTSEVLVKYVPFQEILNHPASNAMPVVLQSQRLLSFAGEFFNKYMDVLVALWFVVFCFKWLRLSLGISYFKRVTRFESSVADRYWLQRLEELKSKLGVTKSVQLLKSNIINMPATGGFFKPVILVPVSLFTNMSPDLVESILLHELAHIRRRDYIVNMLQCVAETIFFFNPFILKISSLIKEERENCCDALAVEIVQNKVSYVQALVAFSEYANRTRTAVAFAGRRNYLLQRVKRILYNQNKKPGVMEKSILACSVILFLGLAMFSTVNGTEKVLQSSFVNSIPTTISETVSDTVPDNKQNKKQVQREVRKAQRAQKAVQQQEQKVQQKQEALQEAIQELQKAQQEIGADIQINNEQIQELLESNELNLKNDLNVKTKINLEKLNEINVKTSDLQKELALLHVEKVQPLIDEALAKVELHRDQIITGLNYSHNNEVSEILSFLEKNNVAKRAEITSFSLNENELMVNNVKQPDHLHRQLEEKYIESKGDHINYHRKGKGTTISIQRNRPDPA